MIPYIFFALLFALGIDALRQSVSVSIDKGRLNITGKPGPLVIAGLIRMDETEAGISFELVGRRGGAK